MSLEIVLYSNQWCSIGSIIGGMADLTKWEVPGKYNVGDLKYFLT